MMVISHKPHRLHVDHAAYFLTLVTYRRQKILLLPDVAAIVIHDLGFYARRVAALLAYTVQADHLHVMVEVERAEDLSSFLCDFKKHTSRLIGLAGRRLEEHVWLLGTWDHWIRPDRNQRDFTTHVRYIYSNCWKHQAILPKDYPYHNFWEGVRRGWVDASFCVAPPGKAVGSPPVTDDGGTPGP
ncbi:MAG: transposase [Bacteroidetes bacterium]|jgi:REP element-mobilizing transposase RayT|nr:transposase [Bacteroidota bacterium]